MDKYADFAQDNIFVFRPSKMNKMREVAEMNKGRPRYRICAHQDTSDNLQEMYICAKDEGYIPVYKHPDTATTHFILEGIIALVIFDEAGRISRVEILDKEKGAWSCRVGAGIYYMTFVVTTWATYFECKAGPFTAASNVLAPWTPDAKDGQAVDEFMKRVEDAVNGSCRAIGLGTIEDSRKGRCS